MDVAHAQVSMADWSKLAKYMPTGIFLTFQSLVTITVHDTADNKDTPRCNRAEFWVTVALLATTAALSIIVAFTDSVTHRNGGWPEDHVLWPCVARRPLEPDFELLLPAQPHH